MKRYIHASFDISRIESRAEELKDFFKKNDNDAKLVAEMVDPVRELITEYVISRQLSGRGIELYVHITKLDRTRSFGGGDTLARGYFDVAQYMLNLEDDGMEFVEGEV